MAPAVPEAEAESAAAADLGESAPLCAELGSLLPYSGPLLAGLIRVSTLLLQIRYGLVAQ